jgi:hypothetical protein
VKAQTLVDILRDEAVHHRSQGDALPAGEDAIPYAIGDAFNHLADEIESRVEIDL